MITEAVHYSELARARREHLRLLAAVLDSVGGEVRIGDVTLAMAHGDGWEIETYQDTPHRCTVLRLVKDGGK